MYSRFAVQTRLSTAEAESALERLVDVKHDESTLKPFVGRLENGTFQFRRVITGRNSFIPIISGRIVQGEDGAVVRGVMRLHLYTAVFMTIWMGIAVIATMTELARGLHEHHLSSAIGVVLFPLFGIALVAFGYYPERRKAMRLLTDAFQ